jgi:haloacetate dehalogenase
MLIGARVSKISSSPGSTRWSASASAGSISSNASGAPSKTVAATGPITGVAYYRCRIGEAEYLFARSGGGNPLLLLHGFPETHYCWRGLIPALAQSHLVVAADLRGYGGSRAVVGGPRGEGFSKREMAADLVELMRSLGFDSFTVVGHDRGARVAYRMALDHPQVVERLAVINVIPTVDQFERMTSGPSLGYWPWFLLAQPAPFPEQLIGAAPEQFLRFIFDSWAADSTVIDEEAFGVYLAAFAPAAAAICADYRASFWLDREHDEHDLRAGRRIECPTLVIAGSEETQLDDAAEVWRRWAIDVRAATAPGGHFVPEEAPEFLAVELGRFLATRA